MAKKYNIHIKKSKEGSLHSALHVPKEEKIPSSKLRIKSTDSPALKKKKQFAINAKHFKHQTGGNSNIFIPKNTLAINAQQDADIKMQQDLYPTQHDPNAVNNFENTPEGKKMLQKYKALGYNVSSDPGSSKIRFKKDVGDPKENPLTKDFNTLASVATGIGDTIQQGQQNHSDKLQLLDSMTPKFFQNMEAQGLNNVPAFTQYGGHGEGGTEGIIDHSVGPNFKQYSRGIDSDTSSGRSESDVPVADPRYLLNADYNYEGIAHTGPYGNQSIYRTGGSVSSNKAKEILHDGTVHGQPLTEKQRKYFGWIAGVSKAQVGGQVIPVIRQTGGSSSPEDYYKSSATLSYYKNKLNDQLKSKNPTAFGTYFKGLQGARGTGKLADAQNYIQNADYNDYLSPDEVKKTLGNDDDYQKYLNSLKAVNTYNVSQGQQPLYGNVEGQSNDPSQLNYGRRFASLQVTPSFAKTLKSDKGDKTYSRNYQYNPKTGQVEFVEEGDTSLRPEGFSTNNQQPQQTQTTASVPSKKYGGRKYQAGGYAIGDELDLTPAQIKELKKQGYKIEQI